MKQIIPEISFEDILPIIMRTDGLLLFGLMLFLRQSCKPSDEITSEKPSGNIIAIFADQKVALNKLKIIFNRNRNTKVVNSPEIRE